MKTYPTEKLTCPKCKDTQDCVSGLPTRPPQHGSVMLCLKCAAVNQLVADDKGERLAPMTPGEIAKLPLDLQFRVISAVDHIRRRLAELN